MITEFLIGIGINGVYDLIKASVKDITEEENSELIEKIYNCVDCSVKEFFEHYHNKYGKPNDSFLARQENYNLIVKQMFYSEKSLLRDKLNRSGFNGITADDESIDYFIDCLSNEMKKHYVLDKIIAEKECMNKIDEIYDTISNRHLENKNNKLDFTIKNSDGKQVPFEKGRIYHKKYENGVEYKIMINEGGYHVEVKDIYDRVAYYDLDFHGRVTFFKPPFELTEFELVIPNEQVIRQDKYTIPNGYGMIYMFKWDKKVIAEFNNLGKLIGIQAEVKSFTNYDTKKIIIMPDEEEKEKNYEL